MTTMPVRGPRLSWRLTYEKRPPTVNGERSAHWKVRAASTEEWRTTFAWLARSKRVPPMRCVALEVEVEVANRRSMPDPGACYPAVKAAVDGLVDAGVIPDDGPAYVASILLWAPRATGRNALTLVVSEAP